MDQLGLPFDEPRRAGFSVRRHEPAVWIARVTILRELRADAVVRDLHLRRGLNVLWARPYPAGEPRLNEGRLSGHTAGKTTFCRLLRYLLGEERFAAPRVQDRIRTGDLRDGWVLGEVIVSGQSWTVGRPFALHLHPFAAKGLSFEEAIAQRGSYQEFREAVSAATTDKLHVARLPSSGAPIDWPLLLAWLTRDQEARFAGVDDWRSARSESTSPNPPAADRGAVLRATLGLLSDHEATLQRRWAELDRSKDEIDRREGGARVIASDRRRRLALELGLPSAGSADLFDPAAAKIEERRAEVTKAKAHLADVEIATAEAQRSRDEAARERDELAGQIKLLARRRDSQFAPVTVEGRPSARTLRVVDGGEAEILGPPSAGRCNVPLRIARERGCLLAGEPVTTTGARASEPVASTGVSGPVAVPKTLDLDAEIAALTREHDQAVHLAGERADALARSASALSFARSAASEADSALRSVERLVEELRAAEDELEEVTRESALRQSRMETVTEQRAALRRAHASARERLSDRFQSILKALLGDQFRGEVVLTRDGVEPVVRERGDRESSAMDTVKVIAFDLAALTLGFEGHGHFPGFLVHDGPREADMDQAIYDRLFLYAREMEEAFPSASIGFQYIVTTTTPPPASVRKAPWLIDPVLDASTPEGRLLGMDL